jgi:hypothetical protein
MRVALVSVLVVDILFETITGIVQLVNMARLPEDAHSWNLPSLPPGDIDPRHLVLLAAGILVVNCILFASIAWSRFPASMVPALFFVGLVVSIVQQFYLEGYTFASIVTVGCILYALWVKMRYRHFRFLRAWTDLVMSFVANNRKLVFVQHLVLSTCAQLVIISLGAASYSWVILRTSTTGVPGVFASIVYCLSTWWKTQLVLYWFHMRLCNMIVKWTQHQDSDERVPMLPRPARVSASCCSTLCDRLLLCGELLEFAVLIMLADLVALAGCCTQAQKFGVSAPGASVVQATMHTRSLARAATTNGGTTAHPDASNAPGNNGTPTRPLHAQVDDVRHEHSCCETLDGELRNYNMYSLTAAACLPRSHSPRYWENLSFLIRQRLSQHPLRVGVIAEHNLTIYTVFFLAACVGVWSGYVLTWVEFARAAVSTNSAIGSLDALSAFRPYLCGWLLGYWLTMNLTQLFQTCILTWMIMIVSPEHSLPLVMLNQIETILTDFARASASDAISDVAVLRALRTGSGATGIAVQSLTNVTVVH